ncbi:MAG: dihydropteroate synthase [Cyanobacteria bacterium P01_F01_bin.150]
MNHQSFQLNCRGHFLDCTPNTPKAAKTIAHVMGILNVTPDSFSDGGKFQQLDAALAQTERMINEGAVIIDVGGESSRPKGVTYGKGADPVSLDEELRRVVPVIKAISERFPNILVSIDTYKPQVARAALDAGANILNDITGLRIYPETAQVAAEYNVPLILMHSLGRPGAMPHEYDYDNVVQAVVDSLQQSIQIAKDAGVGQIVTDPGFGFGKSVTENLQLIASTKTFVDMGYPVLVGVSRKSTIGAVLGTPDSPAPVGDRLHGSLGATATAVLNGATLIRTHDVKPTIDFLKGLSATRHHD